MNAQISNNNGPQYNPADLFAKARTTNPVSFPAIFPAQEGDEHPRFGNAYRTGNTLMENPYAIYEYIIQKLPVKHTEYFLEDYTKLWFHHQGIEGYRID